MDNQDTKFNYKIILAALCAVILGILIAFYYSYAQSKSEIEYLEKEKALLVKDLTLMKADVDRLSALDEMNDIELQNSRYRIQQLIDSVGKLNFTVAKLREYKGELRILEAKNDSLELKNDFLKYNNVLLTDKYETSQNQIEELKRTFTALTSAESAQKRQMKELAEELKVKTYLKLYDARGGAYRMRSGKLIQSNKASTISKLKGTVVLDANSSMAGQKKILYFQFLGPNMGVIEDNANTIIVNGDPYSKRVEVDFDGKLTEVFDFITIPEGSLSAGNYTLNVFEDGRLLESVEFQLK
jgi:type II secretory pathway component PulJ